MEHLALSKMSFSNSSSERGGYQKKKKIQDDSTESASSRYNITDANKT